VGQDDRSQSGEHAHRADDPERHPDPVAGRRTRARPLADVTFVTHVRPTSLQVPTGAAVLVGVGDL
jgi:hypothetical protein